VCVCFLSLFGCIAAVCSGEITDSAGVVLSPNWPEAYDKGQDCIWGIHVEEDKRIMLDIQVYVQVNDIYIIQQKSYMNTIHSPHSFERDMYLPAKPLNSFPLYLSSLSCKLLNCITIHSFLLIHQLKILPMQMHRSWNMDF